MSHTVARHVWKHSRARSGALLVLLALAEHAHPDGTGAFPSVPTLARFCRMTERNVQLHLRELESMGEIQRTGRGPRGVAIYRVILGVNSISPVAATEQVKPTSPPPESPGVKPVSPPGEAHFTPQVNPASPKPSINPHLTMETLRPDDTLPGTSLTARQAWSLVLRELAPTRAAQNHLSGSRLAARHGDTYLVAVPTAFAATYLNRHLARYAGIECSRLLGRPTNVDFISEYQMVRRSVVDGTPSV